MIIGILIVLFGLSIILKAVFHVDLPLFRIALGLFLLYLGVQLILGWPRWHRADWSDWGDTESTVFMSREIRPEPGEKPERAYTVAFGRALVDLSGVKVDQEDVDVEINVAFGHATVKVAPGIPLEIDASAAFGNVELPNRAQVALGRQVYRSDNAATAPHRLRIKTHVSFGAFTLAKD